MAARRSTFNLRFIQDFVGSDLILESGPKKTLLLTGATGLLGRYLLRDLLVRGVSLAVLVRPSRAATAADRVEAIIGEVEAELGRALPRPHVLSGDLRSADLGLDPTDVEWIRENVGAVVHSAASLTFYEKDGEPERTNVAGTQHVLDLCERASIPIVHHISSSYVAGLRTGRVLESELDVGQEFGNDYERSKVRSERLVRECTHLDAYNIYRPSIIVGDSNTGFSTTFHGFYTPLRLAAAICATTTVEQLFAVDHFRQMGLQGDEGKNFVPVDWVSEVISTIIDQRPAANETFAVVADQLVTVELLVDVYREVLTDHFGSKNSSEMRPNPVAPEPASLGPAAVIKAFEGQLAVYRSYWRDDPRFDDTNRRQALPMTPCPVLDRSVLKRLCQFAVDHQFTWAAQSPTASDRPSAGSFFPHLRRTSLPTSFPQGNANGRLHPSRTLGAVPDSDAGRVLVTVTGSQGGCWVIGMNEDAWTVRDMPAGVGVEASDKLHEVRMNAATFDQLRSGTLSWQQATDAGRLLLKGDKDWLAECFRVWLTVPV